MSISFLPLQAQCAKIEINFQNTSYQNILCLNLKKLHFKIFAIHCPDHGVTLRLGGGGTIFLSLSSILKILEWLKSLSSITMAHEGDL